MDRSFNEHQDLSNNGNVNRELFGLGGNLDAWNSVSKISSDHKSSGESANKTERQTLIREFVLDDFSPFFEDSNEDNVSRSVPDNVHQKFSNKSMKNERRSKTMWQSDDKKPGNFITNAKENMLNLTFKKLDLEARAAAHVDQSKHSIISFLSQPEYTDNKIANPEQPTRKEKLATLRRKYERNELWGGKTFPKNGSYDEHEIEYSATIGQDYDLKSSKNAHARISRPFSLQNLENKDLGWKYSQKSRRIKLSKKRKHHSRILLSHQHNLKSKLPGDKVKKLVLKGPESHNSKNKDLLANIKTQETASGSPVPTTDNDENHDEDSSQTLALYAPSTFYMVDATNLVQISPKSDMQTATDNGSSLSILSPSDSDSFSDMKLETTDIKRPIKNVQAKFEETGSKPRLVKTKVYSKNLANKSFNHNSSGTQLANGYEEANKNEQDRVKKLAIQPDNDNLNDIKMTAKVFKHPAKTVNRIFLENHTVSVKRKLREFELLKHSSNKKKNTEVDRITLNTENDAVVHKFSGNKEEKGMKGEIKGDDKTVNFTDGQETDDDYRNSTYEEQQNNANLKIHKEDRYLNKQSSQSKKIKDVRDINASADKRDKKESEYFLKVIKDGLEGNGNAFGINSKNNDPKQEKSMMTQDVFTVNNKFQNRKQNHSSGNVKTLSTNHRIQVENNSNDYIQKLEVLTRTKTTDVHSHVKGNREKDTLGKEDTGLINIATTALRDGLNDRNKGKLLSNKLISKKQKYSKDQKLTPIHKSNYMKRRVIYNYLIKNGLGNSTKDLSNKTREDVDEYGCRTIFGVMRAIKKDSPNLGKIDQGSFTKKNPVNPATEKQNNLLKINELEKNKNLFSTSLLKHIFQEKLPYRPLPSDFVFQTNNKTIKNRPSKQLSASNTSKTEQSIVSYPARPLRNDTNRRQSNGTKYKNCKIEKVQRRLEKNETNSALRATPNLNNFPNKGSDSRKNSRISGKEEKEENTHWQRMQSNAREHETNRSKKTFKQNIIKPILKDEGKTINDSMDDINSQKRPEIATMKTDIHVADDEHYPSKGRAVRLGRVSETSKQNTINLILKGELFDPKSRDQGTKTLDDNNMHQKSLLNKPAIQFTKTNMTKYKRKEKHWHKYKPWSIGGEHDQQNKMIFDQSLPETWLNPYIPRTSIHKISKFRKYLVKAERKAATNQQKDNDDSKMPLSRQSQFTDNVFDDANENQKSLVQKILDLPVKALVHFFRPFILGTARAGNMKLRDIAKKIQSLSSIQQLNYRNEPQMTNARYKVRNKSKIPFVTDFKHGPNSQKSNSKDVSVSKKGFPSMGKLSLQDRFPIAVRQNKSESKLPNVVHGYNHRPKTPLRKTKYGTTNHQDRLKDQRQKNLYIKISVHRNATTSAFASRYYRKNYSITISSKETKKQATRTKYDINSNISKHDIALKRNEKIFNSVLGNLSSTDGTHTDGQQNIFKGNVHIDDNISTKYKFNSEIISAKLQKDLKPKKKSETNALARSFLSNKPENDLNENHVQEDIKIFISEKMLREEQSQSSQDFKKKFTPRFTTDALTARSRKNTKPSRIWNTLYTTVSSTSYYIPLTNNTIKSTATENDVTGTQDFGKNLRELRAKTTGFTMKDRVDSTNFNEQSNKTAYLSGNVDMVERLNGDKIMFKKRSQVPTTERYSDKDLMLSTDKLKDEYNETEISDRSTLQATEPFDQFLRSYSPESHIKENSNSGQKFSSVESRIGNEKEGTQEGIRYPTMSAGVWQNIGSPRNGDIPISSGTNQKDEIEELGNNNYHVTSTQMPNTHLPYTFYINQRDQKWNEDSYQVNSDKPGDESNNSYRG